MRTILLSLLLLVATGAFAQSADKLYEEGKKLYDAKNYAAAIQKLKPAAEKGHKKAQYRLGRCYDKGNGVEENDNLAFQWYQKSALQDYAKAQYQLGKCYKNGEGVEKDRKIAAEWFLKAAKQDNANAQLALAKAYMKGKGVTASQPEAKKWLKKAVTHPKDGKKILSELKQERADGDEDAKALLNLIGK